MTLSGPLTLPLSWPAETLDTRPTARDDVAMVDPADRADIDASLRGDPDAYARLIRRHQQHVAARMRRFAPRGDRTSLEELVHDVFVQAYFSLPRYRGDAPFTHWLAVIATRVGYRHWKRRAAAIRTAPLSGAEPAPDSSPSDDDLTTVLNQLPPRDRLVLTLLYLEDHPVTEVARLTGWSQTMVKVQAFRARAKLRKLMHQHHNRSPR